MLLQVSSGLRPVTNVNMAQRWLEVISSGGGVPAAVRERKEDGASYSHGNTEFLIPLLGKGGSLGKRVIFSASFRCSLQWNVLSQVFIFRLSHLKLPGGKYCRRIIMRRILLETCYSTFSETMGKLVLRHLNKKFHDCKQ